MRVGSLGMTWICYPIFFTYALLRLCLTSLNRFHWFWIAALSSKFRFVSAYSMLSSCRIFKISAEIAVDTPLFR